MNTAQLAGTEMSVPEPIRYYLGIDALDAESATFAASDGGHGVRVILPRSVWELAGRCSLLEITASAPGVGGYRP